VEYNAEPTVAAIPAKKSKRDLLLGILPEKEYSQSRATSGGKEKIENLERKRER